MFVVFDTNVYIDFTDGLSREGVRGRAKNLCMTEERSGIQGIANPCVMAELLAHLADATDPCLARSVKAISLLAEHCKIADQDFGLNVASAVETEIRRVLFGAVPEGHEDTVLEWGLCCQLVAMTYLEGGVGAAARVLPDAAQFATVVADREETFRRQFKRTVESIDPTGGGCRITRHDPTGSPNYLKDICSDSMITTLALDFVYQAAELEGKPITDDEAIRYAATVAVHFRIPLEILREMFIRVATTGFDMDHPKKARANSVWDMDISAIAQGGAEGRPMLLVTNDNMVIEAFQRAGYENNVCRPADYLDRIGVMGWL